MATAEQIFKSTDCLVKTAARVIADVDVATGSDEWNRALSDLAGYLGVKPDQIGVLVEQYANTGQALDLQGNHMPKLEKLLVGGKCEIHGAGMPASTAGRTVDVGTFLKAYQAREVQPSAIQVMMRLTPEQRALAIRAGQAAAEEQKRVAAASRTPLILGAAALAALLLLR